MSDEHAAVEAANTAFYTAFETADLDGMRDLWLEDGEALCVHPGALPVRGTPAIHRSWALIMANTPYIQFFLTDVEVSLDGDVAAVTCAENMLTAGDGHVEGFRGGKALALNVFVRERGGWRMWIHQASPVGSAGI